MSTYICNAKGVDNSSHCSLCFPKYRKILKNEDFSRVFDKQKSLVGKYIVVWVGDAQEEYTRLGIIAAKRTFRHAVQRNRAKRLVREAFRHILVRMNDARPQDLVVVSRKSILNSKEQDVEKELCKLFSRLNLINREVKANEVAGNNSNKDL